jgi:hypothetical protein
MQPDPELQRRCVDLLDYDEAFVLSSQCKAYREAVFRSSVGLSSSTSGVPYLEGSPGGTRKPPKYLSCPSGITDVSRLFGYGDYARAALQAGSGRYSDAVETAAKTTAISDAAAQVLGKIAFPVGAGATLIDALCTNV